MGKQVLLLAPLVLLALGSVEDNSECRGHQSCVNQHCIDPCAGACGVNANCDVRNHIPVCSCPPGYTGNPFSSCRIADPEEACHPSPCGANTKCHVANNQAVCTCLPGYRGDCELDSQCPDNLACVGYRCLDPCLGNTQCGSGAVCMARRHIAVCTCPNGRNGDALVNCYDTQSVVATGRYYRFKRDGNYTSQPEDVKVPEAPAAVVTEVKEAETQTKAEEKKE
ncbi:hypothetical protein HF086_006750 [Spodoptera exigua]|uniref:EGF-like domain-containing protein n=1 Tax=Spodoptera exigua TaxID=7107 RepID=A0A922SB14_SPOEX|nr:hypothetical protein HF086_006750 [Spodoptera exigua]